MSVENPVLDEIFTFRSWKSISTNPSVRWVNTYQARVLVADAPASLLTDFAEQIGQFEGLIHYETTQILYTTISTRVPDSHPYDPTAFTTFTQNLVGLRSVSTNELLDLSVCMRVRRQVSFGFPGKIEYRNALTSGDVNSAGGKWVLQSPTGIATLLSGALAATSLEDGMSVGSGDIKFVMVAPSGAVRLVDDFLESGVSTVKLNHKYFDRA